ncbi:MAG: hypothetical protein KIS92_08030 [Planctomycetota bacterium]|nr:hypothetical protein [Planctomycetota bacterium]
MKPRMLPWLLCLALGSAPARASEADYRYAEELLKREGAGLPTRDLVERLAQELERSPAASARLDGMLVRALLCRSQARAATETERAELLAQAKKLYEDFEAKGKGHPLLEVCRAEAVALERDCAKALAAAAEHDPVRGKEKRAEAAKVLGAIADRRKAEAEALRPAVAKAFKDLDAYMEAHPEIERAPGHLVDAARRALNAYIPADKQYVVARLDQLETLDPSDPARKTLAGELAAYCQAQLGWDVYLYPGLESVAMWYGFLKGRVHATAGDDAQAETSWQDAISTVEALDDPAAVKEAREIKLLIGRDFMALLLRQAERQPGRYATAAQVSQQLQRDYPQMASADPGKEVLIGGAKALAHLPDADKEQFEAAVGDLRKVIVLGGWGANAACRALAEVLAESRKRKLTLDLTPQAWFDAAHGLFLDGQIAWRDAQERRAAGDAPGAERLAEDARHSYEQAMQAFRNTIGQTRAQAQKEPLARLQLEPRAWFESGLCAYKLDDFASALLAFHAVDENFSPQGRAKWLPDAAQNRPWYFKREVKEALAALDGVDTAHRQEDGLLRASARNLVAAFQRFRAAHPGQTPPVTPRGWQEEDALAGKRVLTEANDLRAAGLKALAGGDTREGARQCREAFARLKEAARLFAQVSQDDRNYEAALYQAPAAWLAAQSLAAEKSLAAQLDEREREDGRACGRKALEGFAVYEAWVAAHPSPDESVLARRLRLGLAAQMGRANAHFYLREWAKTVEACDRIAALEDPAQDAEASRKTDAAFLKFQALSHLAAAAEPPASDRHLEDALALLPALDARPDWRAYAVRNLMARYSNAVERARQGGGAEARVAAYHGHLADLAAGIVAEAKAPELEDRLRLTHYLREAGRLREAADAAAALLQAFDPEKKNARIDDALWPAVYEKMTRIIRYDDLDKWERCKKDHLALLDLIYDTPEGAARGRKGGPALAHDQQDADYAKALQQLATIRANYADCATNRPAAGAADQLLNGRGFLQAIEDEIVFRQRMLATRDMLADLALNAADELERSGDAAAAKRYRGMAAEQMEVLLETWSDTPDAKLRIARVKLANQEYDAALTLLFEVKRDAGDTSSDLYVRAARLASETCFAAGRFEEAAEYPRRMLTLEVGEAWTRKHWPGMRAFAEACYARGARRPAAAETETAAAGALNYEMATPDEKEFADLQRVYEQGKRTNDANLLSPVFVARYEFLKAKIEHYRSYAAMERRVLEAKSNVNAQVLSAAYLARYEAARALVAAESEAWLASKAYDEAITRFGGVERVPGEVSARRKDGFAKAASLRASYEALARE